MNRVLEAWRPINGFPGYEISNYGSVKSHKRRNIKLIKYYKVDGYPKIRLFNGAGIGTAIYVHRIVALNWIPNDFNLPEIDHLDRNKENNHVKNLEWVTRQENLRRSRINRSYHTVHGEQNHLCKLRNIDIKIIREACANFDRGVQAKVAKYYRVKACTINRIVKGFTWKHIVKL